jgi:HEAT repeat protein
MLITLLALVPLLTPPAALAVAQVDDARVRMALAELDKAFKEGEKAARIRAIQSAAQVADSAVVERLGKVLRDKEMEVQLAAIEALRFMSHPDAVKVLVETAKRDPRIKKDWEVHMAWMRAIGQHGDPSSIEVLTDDIWGTLDYPVVQARILSLGRIRTTASVAKIFELMRTAGSQRVEHMEHFRVALMVLTGVDQGASEEAWLRWWNENKAQLKLDEKPARLPKQLQYFWDRFWGESYAFDRPKKRTERGRDDPEKRPGGK